MKKIDQLREEVQAQLPLVFSESAYQRLLKQLNESGRIGLDMKKRLFREASRVSVKWNHKTEYKLLSFDNRKITIMDILKALQPKYFFSHHSALYFHEITDQRPEEYFLTKEIKGRTPPHSKDVVPEKIRQAFLKAPRKTSKYFEFNKTKVNLLEKQDLKRLGVIKKTLLHAGQDVSGMEINLTSIERTLLDSVISPHYSGGIKTVATAFSVAQFDIDELYSIYETYNLFYPYWQSIGFILHRFKGIAAAEDWFKHFENPAIDFYLDKNFRDDWLYDPEWKIHYPKGVVT